MSSAQVIVSGSLSLQFSLRPTVEPRKNFCQRADWEPRANFPCRQALRAPKTKARREYFIEMHFKPFETVMPYSAARFVPDGNIITNLGFMVCSVGDKSAAKLAAH